MDRTPPQPAPTLEELLRKCDLARLHPERVARVLRTPDSGPASPQRPQGE